MTHMNPMLAQAIDQAAAAVAALAHADQVQWQGVHANRYRLVLSEMRWQAAAVVRALEAAQAGYVEASPWHR